MSTIDCPKCGYQHIPTGVHDDDGGEHECEGCGVNFYVEIEYSPTYLTACMDHEWGPFRTFKTEDVGGEAIDCRFCVYCGKCQLREEAEEKNSDTR